MPKNSSNPRSAPPVYSVPVPKVLQQSPAVTSQKRKPSATKTSLKWSPERITGVAGMRSRHAHGQTFRTNSSIQAWSPALFPNPPGTIQAAKKKKKKAAPVAVPRWRQAWDNLVCYSPNKATDVGNDFGNRYQEVMQAFVDYHREGIRGHCSAGGGAHQNAQTTQDLQAFTSFYRGYLARARAAARGGRRERGRR